MPFQYISGEVPVDKVVSRYMVRYNRLADLIGAAFEGSTATSVNLYIDLYGLYRGLYSRKGLTSLKDYTAFTSTVINMCGHYRAFFKNIRVWCKIFLISSFNVPEANGKFVANYNLRMIEKLQMNTVSDMMNTNRELLDTLCKYLQDIHFLETEFESTVLIRNIILKELASGNKNPNIILSDDIMPIQLCGEFENTVYLKPHKVDGNDISLITYPQNHINFTSSFWGMICKRDSLENNVQNMSISPINFSLVAAINRLPERNIKQLKTMTIANRIIYNAIGEAKTKLDPTTLYNISVEANSIAPLHTVDSRYKAIDAVYQSMLFKESTEFLTLSYDNLIDPEAINMINTEFFSKNPLDLSKLM